MTRTPLALILKAAAMPPGALAARLRREAVVRLERLVAPRKERRLTRSGLLRALKADSLESLWTAIASRPFPAYAAQMSPSDLESLCPGHAQRVIAAAEAAGRRQVDLLGSGPVELGKPTDWALDYKSGYRWPNAWMRSIEYNNRDRPSDVKFPWEVSRMQWAIPLGQAFQLTGDERYAELARALLEEWVEANPYAHSVNWSCTMEAGLRIFSWTWFFHVFHDAVSWRDEGFRELILRSIYLHGAFTERHLEISAVNGNHFTAGAAAMVMAGLFFGTGSAPGRWLASGWEGLNAELPLQVYDDGVNFEGSVPYHRLATELFTFPAAYRQLLGLSVECDYRERLLRMAEFVEAYSKPDGSSPLIGDGDDGRVLPFGGQSANDHRYITPWVRSLCGIPWTADAYACSELMWLLGPDKLSARSSATLQVPRSKAFETGGCYVMRSGQNHVFAECAPVGLDGIGGHGHNDCLAFEAVLRGRKLVSDSGSLVYTASFEERNAFRSTAYHNTPQIDGEEINRFISPDDLWRLRYDAIPTVHLWKTGTDYDLLVASHAGYERLEGAVRPTRTWALHHGHDALLVRDCFPGVTQHSASVPVHLAPEVIIAEVSDTEIRLESSGEEFILRWLEHDAWEVEVLPCRIAPSYGVALDSTKAVFRSRSECLSILTVSLCPSRLDSRDLSEWLDEVTTRTDLLVDTLCVDGLRPRQPQAET